MIQKKQRKDLIWNFIDNHIDLIYFILVTLFAITVRILLMKYNSGDYDMFLKPWFDTLKNYGGLPGLANDIGNYTPIYMTILAILTYIPIDSLITIKVVSIIFDFIGALTIKKIVLELLCDNKHKNKIALLIYSVCLFLPTIILNSSYWAQSDQIYTTFVLISLLFLIKKKYKLAILWWAVAFAFKFQAIFIFPLYVLMYIANRKIKIKDFLIIPITIFVLSIPKVIYSQDLLAGFKVYYNQANTYQEYITLNFPNVYSIFLKGYDLNNPNLINTPFKEMGTIGIIIMLVILITLAYFVRIKKINFDKHAIIEFSLFSVLMTTFLLPQMHERYLFMGDVISLLYLVINKKQYYVPIIIEMISLNGYMYLLFAGFAINISILSIVFLILLILYTRNIIKKYLY